MDKLILKIKRSETGPFRMLRTLGKALLYANMPVPGFLKPVYRLLYHSYYAVWYIGRWWLNFLFRVPMTRARCKVVGKNLMLTLLPEITGHAEVYIGDNVQLHGKLAVYSGRVFDNPRLVIGDRVSIGHTVTISVNREVVIEEGVMIAGYCRIADNDGHPVDPALRTAGVPPPADRTKPVRICRNAWIGHGCYIMKGVTIGEGAIVGSASVVTSDVPPFSAVGGNPARVIKDLRVQPAGAGTTVAS